MGRLVLVLGDQLHRNSTAFDGFDPAEDRVWMAEVENEATHVRSHKRRVALFFAAMRHFRDALRAEGLEVAYTELPTSASRDRGRSLGEVLAEDVRTLEPEALVIVQPGDHRVLRELEATAEEAGVPLEVRPDRHFYCSTADFERWMEGRSRILLEDFYRWMRKATGILVDADGKPEGGRWNFDEDNRASFGREGPGELPHVRRFRPDDVTRAVLALVEARFGDHPGTLEPFDHPVTRKEALAALRDFVEARLPRFGLHQDAMWEGETFLYHSRLSTALNLHLLDPRECVEAAVDAYREDHAPLAAVEGFVRQILGWREFVRGIYWHRMPGYARGNHLRADRDVPAFFWTGQTDMACLRDAVRSMDAQAYAHHIQRLMVFGLFALILGVHPHRLHEWHLAMFADAIDWVSLPNVLGMSQYADGGVVGTKPYCASGKYIDRMSNHCHGCRYDPGRATGAEACPFTTLYWDFLARHRERLEGLGRMGFQLRNLDRKPDAELDAIRRSAKALKARITRGERV